MSEALWQVLTYVTIPTIATVVGGVIAAFRRPSERTSSYIQHFAAGVVFAAVALEFLPELVETPDPLAIAAGFASGTALMLLVRWLTLHRPGTVEEQGSAPTRMLATIGVDIFIDGLLLGIGFAAGEEAGRLLTFALTIELLFLGLSAAVGLQQASVGRLRTIALVTGLALLVAVGAGLGATVAAGVSGPLLSALLAFGVAALLYLVTEELLVEAHEVPETLATTAMFFVGFLLFLMIDVLSI